VGRQHAYQPHKLITAILVASDGDLDTVCAGLESRFGVIEEQFDAGDFEFTDYYQPEMGSGLQRHLLSFEPLIDPGELAATKELTNRLEADSAREDGSRRINCDPGLLSLSRLILATTKPSGHRIPIGDGMHAEVTLLFSRGRYRPLEWTYPDFGSGLYNEWFLTVRARYHEQLRALDPDRPWRL
jgi:hypothetical protein